MRRNIGFLKIDRKILSLIIEFDFIYSKAQIVKISILLAVLFTFSLQLYVCVEIVWNAIKHRFEKREVLANYALRYLFHQLF